MISYPLSWLLSSACTCSLGSCWAGAGSGISGGALSSSASSAGFGLVPSERDHIHIHCTTEGYLWITEVGPVAVLNTTRCTCVCELLHLKIFWLTGLSQSCQHDVFGNCNSMSQNLYFDSKICNAL